MEWILRAWRGQERCWKVFWVYGVVGKIIWQVLFLTSTALGLSIAVIALLVFYVVYFIWLLVSQYRCAFNLEWQFWGYAVRVLVFLVPVAFVAGILLGGMMIGQDLIHTAECRKSITDYAKAHNLEPQAYFEAHHSEYEACKQRFHHTEGSMSGHSPYEQACRDNMELYAKKYGVDPTQYIIQHQGYLQKCIDAQKAHATSP